MNTTPLTPPPEYGLCPSYDESQEKIDALVDNVSVGDLRAILRVLLASTDVATSERFIYAAQSQLLQTSTKHLPAPNSLLLFPSPAYLESHFDNRGDTRPSPLLYRLANRARMLCASGLYREAIQTIICIAQTCLCPGARWGPGSELAELYRGVDEDIVNVIGMVMFHVQGLRQAMNALRTPTPSPPRGPRKLPRTSKTAKKREDEEPAEEYLDLIVDLGTELNQVRSTVQAWDGSFPFQRGMAALTSAATRA
ncbi:unnamed protein product [Rhizoctonia solani]|uniref:Uncharacterized protein n=1 Tax=Rhizoctonia solani TaxID=456999 RepID=A0A8H3GM30_9AGAM|nr:unnamed protein product [Rhizoctonia solani]CAE6515617.1 unnamed protein product [Rhizoctonia solani]